MLAWLLVNFVNIFWSDHTISCLNALANVVKIPQSL